MIIQVKFNISKGYNVLMFYLFTITNDYTADCC